MRLKFISLFVILFVISCSHIDPETKSLLLYQDDYTKIGLGEKRGGVMAKVTIKF